MKRLQIFLLLVTFASGPTLMLRCEHACAPPVAEGAPGDCHGTSAAGTKLVDGHDCSKHTIAPAPAVKETRPDLRFAATPVAAFDEARLPAPIAIEIAGVQLFDTGPPVPGFSRPLRI